MRFSQLVPVAALVLAGLVSLGCASSGHAESEAECKDVKPGAVTSVNTVCVVVNEDPVNPAVEPVFWKDQKVGFCCKGCKPQWEEKTDAQKDALLAQAIAKSKR
jgi:hypothetical protein